MPPMPRMPHPSIPGVSRVALPILLLVFAGRAWAVEADSTPAVSESAYVETIRPLLAERCVSCHGALRQEAGLRLDTAALLLAGGESGPAAVRNDPASSMIVARVADPDAATRMPPDGEAEPLSAEQVAALAGWIAAGCPAPADERPEADPRDHWAFRPRTRPAVPQVQDAARVRNPIDAFLAQAHGRAGIAPQPEAPRHVLVRRLFVDLVGLPPQPEDMAAIEADASPDWYERLVERLLADPRHGERWARHWMDVWRYADWWGLGDQHRNSAKHMWHFRDWIVESLNADLGYDEMLRQMLAADELHPDDPARLRATGFLARNWFLFNRTPWLDETVEHVGKGLLGLTLNCAKCHAHKYDPIRQEDYYRFRAFFEPIETRVDVVPGEGDLERDGIPRVFDGHLDRPTHLFVRGEDTKPDTSRSFEPGVPEVLAFRGIEVRPVSLPPTAFEPERWPWVLEAHVATARRAVESAESAVTKAVEKASAARTTLATAEREAVSAPATVSSVPESGPGSFVDDFSQLDAGRWKLFGGEWTHEPGRLVQGRDGQSRAVVRLGSVPPRDFDATITFTITGGTTYRSVGLSFDSTQPDPVRPHAADDREVLVYASGWASGPKVQAAYVIDGAWRYPAEGAVARSVALHRSHRLRVAVRDTLVNAWFDDEPVLAWRSPVPRRSGSLQLITFDATAVFERVSLATLSGDVTLREPATATASAVPSIDAARALVATAERQLAIARAGLAVEQAALESVVGRAAATRTAWEAAADGGADDALERRTEAATAAVRAERQLAVARARRKVAEAEDTVATAAPEKKGEAEKALAAAREAVEKAVQAVETADGPFTPLAGAKWTPTRFRTSTADDPAVPFPTTSTGRRTALARWITDPQNPLTARVAANHLWMRHMGRPLVSTVFEFGRKGEAPAHPELVDWLASELVDGPRPEESRGAGGWSMKHLHRLICTSAAYRMGSSTAGADVALAIDPDNRLVWRREPIRLEAQVVRDGVLALAGMLDLTMGGPPVRESAQATSRRRSLYFWHSDISRNLFLTTFDDAAAKECYERERSIVPQQALALANAALVHDAAAAIAARLEVAAGDDAAFLERAFETILQRDPSADERAACEATLGRWRGVAKPAAGTTDPARVLLVWVLLNHNDFVTLR
ncbi:MAG: DUF1553 domain-containing protein [Planctomycetaceae bacterium]